jgi:hypothetical protein
VHYRDGKEAQLGDIVKGTPYDIKHDIVGRVIGLTPGTDTCNIRVACVTKDSQLFFRGWKREPAKDLGPDQGQQICVPYQVTDEPERVEATIAYGACKDFELVLRP